MTNIPMDDNEINKDSLVNNAEELNKSYSGETANMSEMDEQNRSDSSRSSDNKLHNNVSANGSEPDNNEAAGEEYADLNQPYVPDRRQEERDGRDRRRHDRSGFTYPVGLKIFKNQTSNTSHDGYIEDISISGAGVKFEDKYGRVQLEGLAGSSIKMIVRMPRGDDIALLSVIKWIRRDVTDNAIVKVGIQFQRMEDWQLKTIKQLISLKNKDHNMMWNLFDNYEKNVR